MTRAGSAQQRAEIGDDTPPGAVLRVVDAEGARLTVAAAARRIGVAPATLRTWDRRYGLGPSEHSVGSHRRYTPVDVARLELMARMLHRGAPPAEAARIALAAAVGERGEDEHDVPLPVEATAVRGLTRAAAALDPGACRAIIEDSLDRRGVIPTWLELVAPVVSTLGDRWESTGSGIEVEHLLSEVILAALAARVASPRAGTDHLPVLLACTPEDQHTLPLFATAAALAEKGIAARVLGARVPSDSLVSAARRTGPGAVMIWSQIPCAEGYSAVEELAGLRPTPLVLLGGPGWPPAPIGEAPASSRGAVDRVDGLREAVTLIARAASI